MADTVQRVMEDMVPELEELQKKGILSKSEVQSVVSSRQHHEYTLRRQVVSKLDFLRAINFELNLVALKAVRKERLGLPSKKTAADFASMKRISFLFERALRKFSGDIQLWKQYLEYSKRIGSHHAIGKILPRAIQLNPKETSLWLLHASWELEMQGNIDGARSIMQRALRLTKSAREVWLGFARMEVRFVAKMVERKRRLGLIEDAEAAEMKIDGADFDLRYHAGGVSNNKAANDEPIDEMAQRQMEALRLFLVPRAIFKNAIATKELQMDLGFRLEFIRLLPTAYSAALSVLPSTDDDVEDEEGPAHSLPSSSSGAHPATAAIAIRSHKLSLRDFAYNHDPSDALLNAFLRYNGTTKGQIVQQIRRKREEASEDDAHENDDEDGEDASNDASLSRHLYHIDFLPFLHDILSSIQRDFQFLPQVATKIAAEFELIRRKVEEERKKELEAAAKAEREVNGEDANEEQEQSDDEDDETFSPEQHAFAIFERALQEDSLAQSATAAKEFYSQHKLEVDAEPGATQLLTHCKKHVWKSYVDFVYAWMKRRAEMDLDRPGIMHTTSNEALHQHLEELYRRIDEEGDDEEDEVYTESIVKQHASYLLETGRINLAIDVLAQAIGAPVSSATLDASSTLPSSSSSIASSSARFKSSVSLWLLYLSIHETLHAFHPRPAVDYAIAATASSTMEQGSGSGSSGTSKKRKHASNKALQQHDHQATNFSSHAPSISTESILALYDRALSSVNLEGRSTILERLLSFQMDEFSAMCVASSPSSVGVSSVGSHSSGSLPSSPIRSHSPSILATASSSTPFRPSFHSQLSVYISIHRTFHRIFTSIPALSRLDEFKLKYVAWMELVCLGENYARMHMYATALGSKRRTATGLNESDHSAAKKKIKLSSSKSTSRAEESSDDEEEDRARMIGGVQLPSFVPSLSLPPVAALRQAIDTVLANTPGTTLELLQACIRVEMALKPPNAAVNEKKSESVPSSPAASTSSSTSNNSTMCASASQSSSLSTHLTRMKVLFERAVSSFGSTCPQLWFSFLGWARQVNDLAIINPNQIVWRATKELRHDYQSQWAEMQTRLIQ